MVQAGGDYDQDVDAGYDYGKHVDEPDGHDDGNSTTDDGILYFHVATAPVANYSI